LSQSIHSCLDVKVGTVDIPAVRDSVFRFSAILVSFWNGWSLERKATIVKNRKQFTGFYD
jgi:hypothetical protein